MNSAVSLSLVVLAGILFGYGTCTQEARHICLKASNDSDTMRVIINLLFNTSVHAYTAVTFANETDSNIIHLVENNTVCSMDANFTEGLAIMEAVVNCSASPAEIISNPCGGMQVTSTEFKWKLGFRTNTMPLLTTIQDIDFNASCACDTAHIGQLQSNNIMVDNSAITQASEQENPNVALRVVDASTNAPVSSASVGDQLKLMAMFDVPNEFVKGVSGWGLAMSHCIAVPTTPHLNPALADRIYLQIIGMDGCSTNTAITIMESNTGFAEDAFDGEDTGTYQWNASTKGFTAFKFTGHSTVIFQCKYEICTGTFRGQQKCLDLCAHSTSIGRKRRQAESESEEKEITVEIHVTGSDDELTDEPDSVRKTQLPDQGLSTTTIVLVAAAIGGVFMLTVLFVIVAVVLLHRRKRIKKAPKEELSDPSKAKF